MKARQAMIKVLGLMVAGAAVVAYADGQVQGVKKVTPILSVPADQVIAAGHAVRYNYMLAAPSSGVHVYRLEGQLVADNLADVSAPILFTQGGNPVKTLTLGAVLATAAVDAGASKIKVLSDGIAGGGVNGISNGATVVIAGKPHTVLSVNDDAVEAVLHLDSALATAVAEGDLVAMQQPFTATVPSVGMVKNSGQPASLSMNISVADVSDAGSFSSDNTFTSVVDIEFSRHVRNVTRPNGSGEVLMINGTGFYSEPGVVTGVSGDIFEYALVVQAGSSSFEGVTLTDAIPGYTSYVPASTTVNGKAVADVDGQSPLLKGMALATEGSAEGILSGGNAVMVLYQVKVD